MKKQILTWAMLLSAVGTLLFSCDDGPIYEKVVPVPTEGRVLKFTGHLTGLDHWTDSYSVVVAGFDTESEYAVISKDIPLPDTDDGEVEVTLSGISDKVSTLELCVINKLRKRIVTFRSMACGAESDTLYMDGGTLDVGMYATIQQTVFNTTCANCHGASTHAAAGLYLTEGRSHEALVGKPSTVMEGMTLVQPGNAEESLLHRLLNTDISVDWGYDHSKEVLSTDILTLIDRWIEGGAEE